jgi:hypothetical protein
MSTERSPERAYRRRAARFRRAVVATLAVLTVSATGLTIAGAFRGPHLNDAAVAAGTALERAGQRLVLHADQAIATVGPDDITITPAVPVEASSDGRAITIRFTGMLRARTEYRVEANVVGASTGVRGVLTYAFTTPDLEIAVLARDLEGPDQVRQGTVSGGHDVRLVATDRIQEFALTRDGIGAIVLDGSGADGRLSFALAGDEQLQEFPLPGPGRLRDLHGSTTTGLLGVIFTADDDEDAGSQLLLVDPFGTDGVARPVTGLDGEPVSVLDWRFVPGTAYLVAQTFDQSLLLVDTASPDIPPTPLGEHAELRGFLPGSLTLVVADPLSGSTIDLQSGETTQLALPDDRLSADDYPGAIALLDDDRYAEIVSRPDADFVLDYRVLLVGTGGVETLYDPEPGVAVTRICLSPNGQYLAVEVQDPDGESDGYPSLTGRTGTTVRILDVDTGETAGSIAGFAASWCG